MTNPMGDPMNLDHTETDSITSTIETEHESDQDWNVKNVLAEAPIEGETRYLIDWEGYPLSEATWEPVEHLCQDLLAHWEQEKSEAESQSNISKNIREWRDAVTAKQRNKFARHDKRNSKRAERGLEQTTYEISLEDLLLELDQWPRGEDENEKQAEEDNESTGTTLGSGHTTSITASPDIPEVDGRKGTDHAQSSVDAVVEAVEAVELAEPIELETASNVNTDEIISAGKTTKGDQILPTPPVGSSSRPQRGTSQDQEETASKDETSSTVGSNSGSRQLPSDVRASVKTLPQDSHASNSVAATSKTVATKVRQKPLGLGRKARAESKKLRSTASTPIGNVFSGGKVRKKPRTLLEASKDSTLAPKLFNHRLARLVEKGSRDKEGTVAPAKRPIGLFSISTGERMVPPKQTSTQPEPIPSETPIKAVDEVQKGHTRDVTNRLPSAMKKATKPKARKSVHWDDNLTIQMIPALDHEESLFVHDTSLNAEIAARQAEENNLRLKVETEEAGGTSQTIGHEASVNTISNGKTTNSQIVSKEATFGSSKISTFCSLKFDALPLDDFQPWVSIFKRQKLLKFSHLVLQKDLAGSNPDGVLFAERLCEGSVFLEHGDVNLEDIAGHLRHGSKGLVSYGQDLCSLVYPSKCDDWETEIQVAGNVSTAHLRFALFRTGMALNKEFLAPIASSPRSSNNHMLPRMRQTVFQNFFAFDYHQLLPARLSDTTEHSFFLAFPPSAGEDAAWICKWLRDCNGNCKISSSLFPAHWHGFVTKTRGVVIIHEDALWSIRLFPGFANLLDQQDGNFKFLLFSKSLRALEPFSCDSCPTSDYGKIKFQQIFLPRKAYLITPSFLVSQPRQALTFVRWYYKGHVANPEFSQLATLVCCAGIKDWLHELAHQRLDALRHSSSMELKQKDINEETVQATFKTFTYIQDLIDQSIHDDLFPITLAPDCIDANDEQSLVNWFGMWSILNADKFRKFVVVSTSETSPRLTWQVKRPRYFPLTKTDPETTYEPSNPSLHSNPNNGYGLSSGLQGDQAARSNVLPDDRAATMRRTLDPIVSKSNNTPFVLYKFPVSYWNSDMAFHFRDYESEFHSYRQCFNWLQPFRLNKNTMMSFMYTIEGRWDPKEYPQDIAPKRRPWIAMFRPVNPHWKPWISSELLIWDPVARTELGKANRVYEDDLIEAQRAMIKMCDEQVKTKFPDMPLDKVWIGSFDVAGTKRSNSLDAAMIFLEEAVENFKQWVPAPEPRLRERGWRPVRLEKAPASGLDAGSWDSGPDESAPMDLDMSELLDESETDQPVELKMVFHPPRGKSGSRVTKCANRLHQHTSAEIGRGVSRDAESLMEYTFRSTLDWYRDQLQEGRGFEHIRFATWEAIFDKYKLPHHEQAK